MVLSNFWIEKMYFLIKKNYLRNIFVNQNLHLGNILLITFITWKIREHLLLQHRAVNVGINFCG